VDGTARPRLVGRGAGPVYRDRLLAWEQASGVPVLINTSFNVHEEPIVNRPEEALQALRQDRVDAVVTPGAIWGPPPGA